MDAYWSRTDGVRRNIADAVGDQNTIRVYVDSSDGLWHATIGPADAAVDVVGSSPWYVLMMLQLELKKRRYRWDHESVLV